MEQRRKVYRVGVVDVGRGSWMEYIVVWMTDQSCGTFTRPVGGPGLQYNVSGRRGGAVIACSYSFQSLE